MSREFLATVKITLDDIDDDVRESVIDIEFQSGFYDTREDAAGAIPRMEELDSHLIEAALAGFLERVTDEEVEGALWTGSGEFLKVSELNLLSLSPYLSSSSLRDNVASPLREGEAASRPVTTHVFDLETASPTGRILPESLFSDPKLGGYLRGYSGRNIAAFDVPLARFDGDGAYFQAQRKHVEDGGTITGRWYAEDKGRTVCEPETEISASPVKSEVIDLEHSIRTVADEIREAMANHEIAYAVMDEPETGGIVYSFYWHGVRHKITISLVDRVKGTNGITDAFDKYLTNLKADEQAKYFAAKAEEETAAAEDALEAMQDTFDSMGITTGFEERP